MPRVNDLTLGSFLMTQGLQWAARDRGEGYSMTLLPPDGEGPRWLPEETQKVAGQMDR